MFNEWTHQRLGGRKQTKKPKKKLKIEMYYYLCRSLDGCKPHGLSSEPSASARWFCCAVPGTVYTRVDCRHRTVSRLARRSAAGAVAWFARSRPPSGIDGRACGRREAQRRAHPWAASHEPARPRVGSSAREWSWRWHSRHFKPGRTRRCVRRLIVVTRGIRWLSNAIAVAVRRVRVGDESRKE